MLRSGLNSLDGIPVVVERKRLRRINVRVDAEGRVHLSVPVRWATIAEGEAFLRANWKWCVETRAKVLARPLNADIFRVSTRSLLLKLMAMASYSKPR